MEIQDIRLIKVADIMVKRVLKIEQHATVMDAIKKMYVMNVGAIVVIDSQDKMVGIFSERDIMRRVIPQQLSLKRTRVADVMTKDPSVIGPDASLIDVFEMMQNLNFRHLPVVANQALVGIVSIKDVAKGIYSAIKKK